MPSQAIIIIGAGASGLMAARVLARAGRQVIILEARNRTGGRIYSVTGNQQTVPHEWGAEFIHGSLPETLALLQEAGLAIDQVSGTTLQVQGGNLFSMDDFGEQWHMIEQRLRSLKHDTTLAEFIRHNFDAERELQSINLIKGYAEGYDAADIERASTFALREEWLHESSGPNFRIRGGYNRLMEFLLQTCQQAGVIIHLEQAVKEIHWTENNVKVISRNNSEWHGARVIVAVPLGVLQQQHKDSAIEFFPDIPLHKKALAALGYGAVVKLLIDFREAFWTTQKSIIGLSEMRELGFLISDASIPTWWTQFPSKSSLLTGWLAGPRAMKWNGLDEKLMQEAAVLSLAGLFNISVDSLTNNIRSFKAINWSEDPYTLGAYTYATPESSTSIKVLKEPLKETLFFTGEHCYHGPCIGTVEAALVSGRMAAERLLNGG